LSGWADQCRAQGGTVIVPHFPNPNGEAATLIATGRADAAEMTVHGLYYHLEYYRYLNCGYPLPLVGGSDKMSNATPLGIFRTFVHIPPEEEFSYESWCRNLRAGRTFASSGPLISFLVDGYLIGDTLQLHEKGGSVEVEARAESIFPIQSLEIIQEGRVVASTRDVRGGRALSLKARISVTASTWLAARAGAADYFLPERHLDEWARGIMAHTSPIFVACGDTGRLRDRRSLEQLLHFIDGSRAYVRELSSQYPAGAVTHHHGEMDHLNYLDQPFAEARAAIEDRLRRG
jgi:hypothetical protein